MWNFLPVMVIGLILAGLSEYYSVSRIMPDGSKVYEKKDRLFFFFMVLFFVIFVGLRRYYNDTNVYIRNYEQIPVYDSFSSTVFADLNWTLGGCPGFGIIERVMRYFHFSSQSFIMAFSAFTFITFLWFIKKHTCDIFLSVYFFITMEMFTFAMAALRQCAAIAFCLIAIEFFLRRKYFLFVLFVIFGISVHEYAFVFFVVPLLSFKPWSNKTYVFIGVFTVAAIFMRQLLGSITDIAISVNGMYDKDEFFSAGVNIFRVLVVWVPVVLSFLVKDKFSSEKKAENLIINLSMLNATVMFLGLFGTANYFARLANYFLIFQIIALPIILRYFDDNTRKYLTAFSFVGYLAYFVYGNGFAQGGFDANYYGISIFKYLGNIFD